ncbi:hypothetical protein KB206_09745 [Microvirga sp. STS02]|uniref:TapB family protein n=1 Tax=Hymenobacter negativus TaxID=2795026 RepID=UPI0018DC2139|nr:MULTISPECIES: hypothetical protein [Bacteria]MBH8569165.1 hypothetical protein [Hymenobacter negativus]MBR7208900.1 hypothetical protein [Microvirga sp. STS02]
MHLSTIRPLHAAAFFLLISVPAQAQLAAESAHAPRVADISDLAFEPSGPFASQAATMGVYEGSNMKYVLLDAEGKTIADPTGAIALAGSTASASAELDSLLKQCRADAAPTQVTVPAGTFSCYPVTGQYTPTNTPQPGPKSGGKQVDYYAPIIGLIKTDYYDSNGKLLQSRVLSKLR